MTASKITRNAWPELSPSQSGCQFNKLTFSRTTEERVSGPREEQRRRAQHEWNAQTLQLKYYPFVLSYIEGPTASFHTL
jgi:hypothetical protein